MTVNPTDSTPVGAMPPNIQTGEKDPTSIQLAKDMRTKRYGKDVRETMARMIEWTAVLNKFLTKFYENTDAQNKEYYRQFTDVMKELSEDKDYYSLPEIAGARGGFDTLGERLEDTNAQLVRKVDKGNVSVSDINKNLGKLDQTFMSDELLQQMAGNTPINAVLADGSLTTPKYTDKSVTSQKAKFIKSSNNLLDKSAFIDGYAISSETGLPTKNHLYSLSKHFPVNGGGKLTIKRDVGLAAQYAFYKGNDLLFTSTTSHEAELSTLSVPAGANFARLAIGKEAVESAQANMGEVIKPYDNYSQPRFEGVASSIDLESSKMIYSDGKLDEIIEGSLVTKIIYDGGSIVGYTEEAYDTKVKSTLKYVDGTLSGIEREVI